METITLQEFKKIQAEQKYKHLGFFKPDGAQIIAFNTNSIKPLKRIEEIETRIKSKALPEGVYIVKAKNYISKNTPTDDYYISKGKINLSEAAPVYMPSADVRSYEMALKDQTIIIRLETENKALLVQIDALNKALAEYETEDEADDDEADQVTTPLSENGGAPAWLNSIIGIATPLLDRHYELRAKALEIEEKKLSQTPPAKAQPPVNDAAVNSMFAVLKNWIFSIPDPELCEQVKTMYRDAETMDEFFNEIEDNYPDLFESLTAALNAVKK